jgi:hypothetical protein
MDTDTYTRDMDTVELEQIFRSEFKRIEANIPFLDLLLFPSEYFVAN